MNRKADNLENSIDQVSIRRASKIIGRRGKERVDENTVHNFMGNAYRLGYVFNETAQKSLLRYSEKELSEILNELKVIKGANVIYKPMYPNFPQQVKEASDFELIMNALMHYVGDAVGVRIMPKYSENKRKILDEKIEYTVLGVAWSKDFKKIAENVLSQKSVWSEQDISDLTVMKDYVDSSELSIKENIATAYSLFPEHDWSDSVKTVTDVLRIAVSFSDGDVSLTENTKFKLSRSQRRTIIKLLENTLRKNNGNTEDFARYPEEWKRLIKTLHISDYVSNDSLAMKAVNSVYLDKPKSFNSLVEKAISDRDHTELIKLLGNRPGDFARRLNHMIRIFPEHREKFVNSFYNVSDGVSLTVLVQMWNFFNGPKSDELELRSVSYKSRNIRSGLIANKLSGDYSDVIEAIENGMKNRNDKKIFIEDSLNIKAVVPLGVRSTSTGSRQLGRGSRVQIAEDKSTIRMFMHWKNVSGDRGYAGRVDLDLSAYFISEDFTNVSAIWYGNLRNGNAKSYHSGDITSAPNGASEFIDVDVQSAIDAGYRYVAMTVYNYTRQNFSEVPEAWVGVMLRDKPQSGEIYDARTVESRFDLNSESVQSTPAIFDLVTREMIWVDSSQKLDEYSNYNVQNSLTGALAHIKSAVSDRLMTVSELVELTATRVDSPEDADLVLNPLATEQVLNLL